MSTYSNRLQPALQNLLQRAVRFFHPRSSCTTAHISVDIQRITLNALCMTISGERTEQFDIFCRVTGFTSDFLSFIDVELIRFFHAALHLCHNTHETVQWYDLWARHTRLIRASHLIRTDSNTTLKTKWHCDYWMRNGVTPFYLALQHHRPSVRICITDNLN